MIDHVAEIAELLGKLSATSSLSANPTLRRSNRIRTIHGSLAIEQNTLSLEQVTAVLNGKHVLHFGTLPQYIPNLVMELLDWAKTSEVNMLIRSCVFHYELELIHPFADGNGRMGRLWHTLLLSKWNPAFSWLPVESIIHDRQQAYYDAINACNNAGESTVFIEFMLSAIKASLIEAVSSSDAMSDGTMDKATLRWKKIEAYLETHDYIMNANVRELCEVSAATANRILLGLVTEGKLTKCHKKGHWVYNLKLRKDHNFAFNAPKYASFTKER